jgi:hypothetical protein
LQKKRSEKGQAAIRGEPNEKICKEEKREQFKEAEQRLGSSQRRHTGPNQERNAAILFT